jgi:putative transposase
VWARLRFAEVRLFPKAENPHTGTIITARPNEVWASDHTMTATVEEGQVIVFVAVDHCTAECVGLHVAKKATRFEALEPLRQGVRDYCGGFRAGAAAGIRNRHDHGSQYSDDYQAEIAFLGMESSPSFVRQPGCNGCVERFIRTLKEQLLWVRVFQNVEELRCALVEFRERYNQRWIVQRLGYLTPPKLASSSLHSEPPHEYTQSECQTISFGTSRNAQELYSSEIRVAEASRLSSPSPKTWAKRGLWHAGFGRKRST